MEKTIVEKMCETKEGSKLFHQDRAILEATSSIENEMEALGVSVEQLAERMAVSPDHLEEILDSSDGPTVRQLSDILFEMGFSLHFHVDTLEKTTPGLQGNTNV